MGHTRQNCHDYCDRRHDGVTNPPNMARRTPNRLHQDKTTAIRQSRGPTRGESRNRRTSLGNWRYSASPSCGGAEFVRIGRCVCLVVLARFGQINKLVTIDLPSQSAGIALRRHYAQNNTKRIGAVMFLWSLAGPNRVRILAESHAGGRSEDSSSAPPNRPSCVDDRPNHTTDLLP